MRRRLVVLACTAVTCTALPASAGALTKTVYAGGPVKWATSLGNQTGASVNNYLLNRVTIHVGDTVDWNGGSLSSFHTVDIPPAGGSDLALVISTGQRVHGVKDAAQHEFWFSVAHLFDLGFNPALLPSSKGGTYTGKTRLESGLPLGARPDFKVTFTKPGVYKYFCDVHPGMVGYVVVKPKGQAIPSAQADAATLRHEQSTYAREAKQLDHTQPGKDQVSVGASSADGIEVYAMFPAVLHVKAGTTVTFSMSRHSREIHTATFGPKGYLNTLAGGFNGNPIDPRAIYASDSHMPLLLTPTAHGNGFANTGALDRDPTTSLPSSGRIDFTTPGTYHFICLIHTFMRGTVVVR